MKQNRISVFLSFLMILLPVIIGFLLWNRLPAQMTIHWTASGQADGSSGKLAAILILPLIMVAVQALCLLLTWKTMQQQNKKIISLVIWIIPVINLFSQGIILATALDIKLPLAAFTYIPIGLMFILIGNYMPKTKQNRYFGIKIKWTLSDEKNWNATHRFAGKLWVFGGLAFFFCIFFPLKLMPWVFTILIAIMVLLPILYSYRFHKMNPDTDEKLSPPSKPTVIISTILGFAIAGFAIALCFTGSLQYEFGDRSFTVKASYWADPVVEYETIDSIEYREDLDRGVRVGGFGSPKLSMGNFRNDEFGNYVCYTYTGCKDSIVITSEGKHLVLSGKDETQTRQIYETILQYMQ